MKPIARRKYRQNVDDSYAVIVMVQNMIAQTDAAGGPASTQLDPLIAQIA